MLRSGGGGVGCCGSPCSLGAARVQRVSLGDWSFAAQYHRLPPIRRLVAVAGLAARFYGYMGPNESGTEKLQLWL